MKSSTVLWATFLFDGFMVYADKPRWNVVNTTRPANKCARSEPTKIQYINNQVFNFSSIALPSGGAQPQGGYGISPFWAQQYMLDYALISVRGTERKNDLQWRCLNRCLEEPLCVSSVVLDSRTSASNEGLTICISYSQVLTEKQMVAQNEQHEMGIWNAYNLICPWMVENWMRGKENSTSLL